MSDSTPRIKSPGRPLDSIEERGKKSFQSAELFPNDLILIRITGDVSMSDGVAAVTQRVREWIRSAQGDVSVFFDLEGFRRYESGVRLRYTETVREGGGKVRKVLVYADSHLVRMGAQVAGLVLPQLKLLDRADFERSLAEATGSRPRKQAHG